MLMSSNDYTFSSFEVYNQNRMCFNLLYALTGNLRLLRPVYIHAGTGLGKSHLLKAVLHKVTEDQKGIKVCLTSAERFSNDWVYALRNGKMKEFYQTYNGTDIDLLLLDGIDDLSCKYHIQDELLAIIYEMRMAGKQIVMTGVTPLKELKGFSGTFYAMLEDSDTVEIGEPSRQERIEILRTKLENLKDASKEVFEEANIEEVLSLIGDSSPTNVGAMIGLLYRIITFSEILQEKISLRFVISVLGKGNIS